MYGRRARYCPMKPVWRGEQISELMMIAALGIPSAFAAWGFEAARQLAQAAAPKLPNLWVDRLDSVDQDEHSPVLICSQFPSRPLRDLLSAHPIPLLVFISNGADALAYQRRHQPILQEAIRTVGASIALIGDCAPQKRALFLDAADRVPADRLLWAMAAHFGLDVSDGAIARLLGVLGPLPVVEDASGPLIDAADQGVASLVLENGIANLRDADVVLKSIWPHRVFYSGDSPNEEAPLVIDATGGSRVLYYGPYFHLAEGQWRAELTLGFTREAVGLPLKVSAYGPGLLGEARIQPRQEGIFAAQFTFVVSEPEHPVEFHVRTEEGAIEGKIALAQAELTHLGPGDGPAN